MKIVQARTVELTPDEMIASAQFDRLLDSLNTPQAVEQVRSRFPNLDPRFYRWLGDEELETGNTVTVLEQHR